MKFITVHKKTILASIGCIITLTGAAVCSMLIWRSHTENQAVSPMSNKLVPIYCVETDEKVLSLGINCAWDNADVDKWLEVLDNTDIKATFFIVGTWCDKYPESVKKIYEHGHEIGNHSDSHPDMTKLSKNDIKKEIETAGNKIEKITGEAPNLFRAPSGAYNDILLICAQELGYKNIQWSIDSIDWKGLTSSEIEQRVISKLDSGAITLFHQGKENSLAALPNIISAAKEQGYSFVPVSQIIYNDNYYINSSGKQISRNSSDNK